ncbi:MAG: cobyric acid synthase [Rubrivivax sp.]|nr:cobyric acid synthase [Rubrivivax sp.]
MTRSLVVWGCSSGAGKSWLATALCRLAVRRGIRVAPFKAQNMSNNARVVQRSGSGAPHVDAALGEIGAAQYFQSLAARTQPHTDMNPVLLKPESDTQSQVVVNGVADAALSRLPWRERSGGLAVVAQAGFQRLAAAHDLVVIEGAGSPAEINLAPQDYVNLGVARWARAAGPTAALLVSDIDRGGAFAHCHGTWALLPDDLRGLLQGFVFNRFRGDATLLAPGPQQLQQLTGVPLAGVVPMLRGHGLPDEDGLADWAPTGPADATAAWLTVAVLAPPHISNVDEFQPLRQLPGVRLVWARAPTALVGADWVILPGSKQVSGDLAWLRATGLDKAVHRHVAGGGAVLGVCGGLQMLGRSLHDPEGHDGAVAPDLTGLGLLPVRTHFGASKRLCAAQVHFVAPAGPWAPLDGVAAQAYEIRCGHTDGEGTTAVVFDGQGQALGWQHGRVLGVYAHGLFEDAAVLRALFGTSAPTLDSAFDRLADHVETALDPALLRQWLGA